jgi:hypothetical protein
MDNIFKEGDRVYIHIYGWGTIMDIDVNVGVKFESLGSLRYFNGEFLKLLSFTEYTLEGFTQERPEPLPNKGDIVWVRDVTPEWRIGHFFKKAGRNYYISFYPSLKGWHTFGDQMTTKNPYKYEHKD